MLKQLIGIVAAVALGIGGAWLAVNYTHKPQEAGVLGEQNLPEGGDLTLQSVDGDVHLSDFRGKVVVLYFGYTACPDICPTSMATLKGALNQMSATELQQVQGVFVSIDPARDTLAHVQEYAQYFHANMRGITGAPDVVQAVAKRYGVFFRKVEMAGSAMAYSMDHSSNLYVIDQNGRLREMVAHGTAPNELATVLRRYLTTKDAS